MLLGFRHRARGAHADGRRPLAEPQAPARLREAIAVGRAAVQTAVGLISRVGHGNKLDKRASVLRKDVHAAKVALSDYVSSTCAVNISPVTTKDAFMKGDPHYIPPAQCTVMIC